MRQVVQRPVTDPLEQWLHDGRIRPAAHLVQSCGPVLSGRPGPESVLLRGFRIELAQGPVERGEVRAGRCAAAEVGQLRQLDHFDLTEYRADQQRVPGLRGRPHGLHAGRIRLRGWHQVDDGVERSARQVDRDLLLDGNGQQRVAAGRFPQLVQSGRAACAATVPPGVRRTVQAGVPQHVFHPARHHHRGEHKPAPGFGDVHRGLVPVVGQTPADRPGHDLVGPGRDLHRLAGVVGDQHAVTELAQRGPRDPLGCGGRPWVVLALRHRPQALRQHVEGVGPLHHGPFVVCGHQRPVEVHDRFVEAPVVFIGWPVSVKLGVTDAEQPVELMPQRGVRRGARAQSVRIQLWAVRPGGPDALLVEAEQGGRLSQPVAGAFQRSPGGRLRPVSGVWPGIARPLFPGLAFPDRRQLLPY